MEVIFYTVLSFVVFVIGQSFVINGIKIASSGKTEKKPDGTDRDSPMILYPIAKFLNQKTIDRVYYSGNELSKLVAKLNEDFPGILPNFSTRILGLLLFDNASMDLMVGVAKKLKAKDIHYIIDGKFFIRFYKEYDNYKFSKWVRMPTFGCIRCMSSFWSLFTYWLPMIWVFDFHIWMVPLWVANISAVTFVNTYIAQRYTE